MKVVIKYKVKIKGNEMKKNLLAATLLSVAATGAFAQAKNFEGFTVGVNVSTVGASTNATVDGETIGFGSQSFVPSGEIGYNYAATENIVLGLTATYDFTKTNAGQLGNSYTLEMKDRYSVNFKPGYAVTKEAMVYALVGYNSGTGQITNVSGTKNFTGIGYGFGTSVLLDKNIFVKAEVQRIDFGSVAAWGDIVSIKPSATVGTLGLGYKF